MVFFLIALVATISLRAVNVVLDFHTGTAKALWYVGVCGFTVFFIYKYRKDSVVQRELKDRQLVRKFLHRDPLTDADYEVIGTILCGLHSKKDRINYFFIFFSSALALIAALIVDLR
ncbi:MAG: hypothetical protein GF333_04890 [Candidatus Omnitrophica bacterium]|nr:hypothetical protein [Candidatus Omnitrophota bacterium]